jgi:hypothetical protein
LRDALESQIVGGWTQPAASEYQLGAATEGGFDLRRNRIQIVGDNADVPDSPAKASDHPAQVLRVGVEDYSKQDLVADDYYLDLAHRLDYTGSERGTAFSN